MPCVPSRANHTLLRSCCTSKCNTSIVSYSATHYYSCKENIDLPPKQITLCDMISSFAGRTMTSDEFVAALSSALSSVCGPINAVITVDSPAGSVDVATIINGVVEINDEGPVGPLTYEFVITGNDRCVPSSPIGFIIS